VENKQLPESARSQLKGIAELKRKITDGEASLSDTKNQASDLTADQTRLRQNIDSLNRVKGQEEQVRHYSSQLSDNEGQIAKLNDQLRTLTVQQSESNRQLRDAIEKLDF
jgi:methyl-accepting chemotaxis protein